ncbi:hypothetical protein CR513_15420, partial [Mucuna pruriens]
MSDGNFTGEMLRARVKPYLNDLHKIRWGSHLKSQWQRSFEGRYDNLLSLLSTEVQPIALSVLTQFYDLPLRCFTIKDFQLAPTLEEYERLLGMPLAKSSPYFPKGNYPSWASMAKLLRVPELEVLRQKKNRNGLDGILRASLEERLQQLQREEDWPAFIDMYGLLIYGIVLFPQIEDYVDLEAIDAFLGKCDRGENPVIAVLANTYYTLDYCYRKNRKELRCCTSLLYLWMTTHLFHGKKKTTCPIEDLHYSCIKPLAKAEWATRLDEATEKAIRWYSQWNERENVTIKCGGFPNIPLMSTQGTINCNPELTLRQDRYPMVLPPSEDVITPFVIHGLGVQNGEYLRKIRRSWKNIVIRGLECRPGSCGASSSYKSWL